MARCRTTLKLYLDSTRKKYVELVCDLDEHTHLIADHLDRIQGITWNLINDDPTPVPSTRTSPRPPKKQRAVIAQSVGVHTGAFKTVKPD